MQSAKISDSVEASPASRASSSNKSALDYDSFLRLLIIQLKNQDPTSPMKANETVAQLATFSQVQKTVEMTQKLQTLLLSSQFTQAQGVIGHYLEPVDGGKGGVVKSAAIIGGVVVATVEDGTRMELTDRVAIRVAS